MAHQEVGLTRVTQGILQTINKRRFQNFLELSLRYSGFFLLLLIAYLHFIFSGLNADGLRVTAWFLAYAGYLAVLELLRFGRVPFYDRSWFILVRISSNLLLISWLLAAAPLMRGVLVFAYLIPLVSTIVYFPRNVRLLVAIYCLAMLGFAAGEARGGLAAWTQVFSAALFLGLLTAGARQIFLRFLNVSDGIAEIGRRLQGTLSIPDIIDQVTEGVLMLTGANGLFVLIIDPEQQSIVGHKVVGIKLNPSFAMDELIRKCEAIRHGKRYENEHVEGGQDEAYFEQFFSPPPRTILVEPIVSAKSTVLGLIMIGGDQPGQFDALKKRDLRHVADTTAEAVEASLIYRKARLSLSSHKSSAEQLLEAEEEPAIAKILVEQASKLIENAEGCVLHRFEDDKGYLVARAGTKPEGSGKLVPWEASHTDARTLGASIMSLGRGIAGCALAQNKLIIVPDVTRDPRFEKSAQVNEFITLMSAPIVHPVSNLPMGTLSVHSKLKNAFTIEDQATLLSLAKQGATSFVRAHEFDEWRLKGGVLKQIFESAMEIEFERDVVSVCRQLVEIARKVLPFEMVRLRLYDPVTADLISVAAAGYPEGDLPELIGKHMPLAELGRFLREEYRVERSYLIPSNAEGWREFAQQNLYIPKDKRPPSATWDEYDAFFTPLAADERQELIGFLAWDQPKDSMRPARRIIEAVGAFASMAGWSINLARAYRRISQQRSLITSFIASTVDRLETASDISVVGDVAVSVGRDRLHTEACSLYRVVDNSLELTHSTYLGDTTYIRRRKPISAEDGSGLSSWVAATRKPLLFNAEEEYQNHRGWAGEKDQLQYLHSGACKNLLLVPIIGRAGNCVGVLSFENKNQRGAIADFDAADVLTALNLAEELDLSLTLAERVQNVKTLEQKMLEDDLHELKNLYYYGVQSRVDTSLHWLRKRDYQMAERQLSILGDNSSTILDELYSLHNSVQKKYYQIEDFHTALDQIVDMTLRQFVGKFESGADVQSRIKIAYAKKVQISPVLRYVFIRIAFGALMNAIKHSGFLEDPKVRIRLKVEKAGGRIQLKISDNGRGAKEIHDGYGINRMRDLVREMGKKGFDIKLTIRSGPGKGTEVSLSARSIPTEA